MPCKNHQHKPWPSSGNHHLTIEACETTCGWCAREITPASNLRAHARRHIKNPVETRLHGITITISKAGRKRLRANGIHHIGETLTDDQITPGPVHEGQDDSDVHQPATNVRNGGETSHLKARITQLEALLTRHGIEIPDVMADQLQEEEQYDPVMDAAVEGQRNLPALYHLYHPTQEIGDPNTFAAVYLQLIATDWFWGNYESMWKHQIYLSRVILSKGGLDKFGVDRKLGRMVVSTFMAIVLVEDCLPELVLESKFVVLEDVQVLDPIDPLTPSEYHDNMMDQATPQLYKDVLALIRKVQQPGHARDIIADEVWAMERRILDEIEAQKKKGNILREGYRMQFRPWPDYDVASQPAQSHCTPETRYLLMLAAAQIYLIAIRGRVKLSWTLKLTYPIGCGLFETPAWFWRGREEQLLWIMPPFVYGLCSLEVSWPGAGSKVELEVYRRQCKAIFLRVLQYYMADNWHGAKTFLKEITTFLSWLRSEQ